MPIFDFFCNRCKKGFERFVFSFKDAAGILCPNCGSKEIKKMLSEFNCASGSSSAGGSGGKCDTTSSCGGGGSSRRFG